MTGSLLHNWTWISSDFSRETLDVNSPPPQAIKTFSREEAELRQYIMQRPAKY